MKTFTVDHTNSFLKACPLPYVMWHDLVENIIGQASGDLVIFVINQLDLNKLVDWDTLIYSYIM